MPASTSFRARSGVVMRRKTLAHQHVDRVSLQRQLQQHGVVLEEVEAVPGHVGARLEIHQIELFGQLHVVQRLEVELRQRRLAAEQLQVRLVVHADRARRGARGWGSAGGSSPTRRRSRRVPPARPGSFREAAAPRSFRASRSAGSLALPIDLETSFAWRLSSSTSICMALRSASSCTKRSTSTFTPRLTQFCLTSSAFSTMNRRSSMGKERDWGLGIGD